VFSNNLEGFKKLIVHEEALRVESNLRSLLSLTRIFKGQDPGRGEGDDITSEWLTYLSNCNSVKKLGLRSIHPPRRPIADFRDG